MADKFDCTLICLNTNGDIAIEIAAEVVWPAKQSGRTAGDKIDVHVAPSQNIFQGGGFELRDDGDIQIKDRDSLGNIGIDIGQGVALVTADGRVTYRAIVIAI